VPAKEKVVRKKRAKRKNKLLPMDSEWTFGKIELFDKEIAKIAKEHLNLDTYPNQIEIITSEQMLDAYSSVGMPVSYTHWSFGKEFVNTQKHYKRGRMGLAYEIVINSSPCIAYLMEENTMCMQMLTIAHASYGHNAFFKGNYLFQEWTDAEAIIDYLVFAKSYIRECEEAHGEGAVEELLDSCHALMNYGVDQYKRPVPLSIEEEKERQEEREKYLAGQVNEFWMRTVPQSPEKDDEKYQPFPEEPQENLLYFFEKHSPNLEVWEREVIRIVRKMSQYFYPQRQTRLMNEGFACFCHYHIVNEMWEQGLIDEEFMIEFIRSHTAVTKQPAFDSPYYSGINVYALGFAMYQDIKRMCEEPTDEDREWFPHLAGKDWREEIDFAMRSFKDDSFVAQYLSPKVIRDFKLFGVTDDDDDTFVRIEDIHDDQGYRNIRRLLSNNYSLYNLIPGIVVDNVDIKGDRSLTLVHTVRDRRVLDHKSAMKTIQHVQRLWGFDVTLMCIDEDEDCVETYQAKNPS
jgi:spore cortex formation protein SpoVR/YcgB (stage V sporulation)